VPKMVTRSAFPLFSQVAATSRRRHPSRPQRRRAVATSRTRMRWRKHRQRWSSRRLALSGAAHCSSRAHQRPDARRCPPLLAALLLPPDVAVRRPNAFCQSTRTACSAAITPRDTVANWRLTLRSHRTDAAGPGHLEGDAAAPRQTCRSPASKGGRRTQTWTDSAPDLGRPVLGCPTPPEPPGAHCSGSWFISPSCRPTRWATCSLLALRFNGFDLSVDHGYPAASSCPRCRCAQHQMGRPRISDNPDMRGLSPGSPPPTAESVTTLGTIAAWNWRNSDSCSARQALCNRRFVAVNAVWFWPRSSLRLDPVSALTRSPTAPSRLPRRRVFDGQGPPRGCRVCAAELSPCPDPV